MGKWMVAPAACGRLARIMHEAGQDGPGAGPPAPAATTTLPAMPKGVALQASRAELRTRAVSRLHAPGPANTSSRNTKQ